MATLYNVLVIVHIICWVGALIPWVMRLRAPRVAPGQWHAIAAAVVTGIALTGIASASDAVDDPNNTKVAVKLVIAVAAGVLAVTQQRKPAPNPLAHAVAGLVIVNVALAYLW